MSIEAPQITYKLTHDPAFPGMVGDTGTNDTESAIAEEEFDAGMGVVLGAVTSPGTGIGASGGSGPTVKKPTSAADVADRLVGVTRYIAAAEPIEGSANRFAGGSSVPCLTQGRIWVQVDGSVGASLVDGGPVFLTYTGPHAGKFRGDAAGVAEQIPSARCKIGAASGGVALIKINIP